MFKELGIKSRMLMLTLLAILLGFIALIPFDHAGLLQGWLGWLVLLLFTLALSSLLALRLSRPIETRLQQLEENLSRLLTERDAIQKSLEQAEESARQNLETSEIQNLELQMTRKEALEANRIKSEFLSNMSHEIRTPLNGILGYASLLGKTELAAHQHDYLQIIEHSAENLLGILSEVLDFSKIEAGKLALESKPFNLRDLIQDCLSTLAPAAHEKQLELVSLVYSDTPTSLIGDPLRLKQILGNLLGNAISFTKQGSIVVRAMLEDENDEFAELRISVQDSGIGVDTAEAEKLFNAFSQADNSLTRQVGGAGLGLTISKRLVELMGGQIGVECMPGAGSEFWISLSLAKANQGVEPPPAALLGRRVIVLENHPLARQSLEHQLRDCGLKVSGSDTLDSLLQSVANALHSPHAISLAVIGASSREISAEQLRPYLLELQKLDCKALVFCPSTEQELFQHILENPVCQLQAKPASTRKLLRALGELLTPGAASPQLSQPPVALPSSEQPRVLCVDDNPANLFLVQTLLTDLGVLVTAVDSGYAALKEIAEAPFDLVLMDIQMPGMDGRQASIAIRQREQELQLSAVPIVALTAHTVPNQKRSLLQDGLNDLMIKPINQTQLAQLVLKWTGKQLQQPATPGECLPANLTTETEQLAILDPDEGLRLAGGKAELASDLLGMLLDSLSAEQHAIQQARANNCGRELAERVHRLLGATRYCGVPQLRAACQRCEILLKHGESQAHQALVQLDEAISRLLQEAPQQQTIQAD